MRTVGVPALAIAVGVTPLLAACGSAENQAKPVVDTIVAALAPVHPRVVCDNGDAGTGIDNDVPWFTLYLVLDRTPDLDQTVMDAAGKTGFRLEPDLTRARSAARAAASYSAGTSRLGPHASSLETRTGRPVH
jgi:hypothetical protein